MFWELMKWKEKILHHFGGHDQDPASSAGVVLDAAGNVYGVTSRYVYQLVAANAYALTKLGTVNSANDLIWNGGNLYGTSEVGGGFGQNGYIFEITP